MTFRLLVALLSAFILAACGGGGGGGGGSNNPPPGGGNNPPGGGGSTGLVWEALDYVQEKDSLLAQLNAQGARGFAYYGSQVFQVDPMTGVPKETVNLFAKGASTYQYEILTPPDSTTTFIAQTNAQGDRGYHLYGQTLAGFLYIKDQASNATYTVEILDAIDTSDAFLAQANAQGARGFYAIGNYVFDVSTFPIRAYAMYSKDDTSNSTFAWALQPSGSAAVPGPQELIAQANAQGQQGFRYISGNVFTGNPTGEQFRNMYVKDLSEASASFSYSALDYIDSRSGFITQANTQAQAGSVFTGNLVFDTSDPLVYIFTSLYVKPSNCISSVLCRLDSPL